MKRILIILLLALVAFPAFAQMGSPIIIPIWPDGAPNDNGIVTEEGHPSPRSVDNVSKPELWVFPAFRPNGTVIIACPGGGYYYLEIEKEGTGLAPWFNYIGVTLAVLKYRMPNGHFETTLSDVQEAVKIMRLHTEDWGVNEVELISLKWKEIKFCIGCLSCQKTGACVFKDDVLLTTAAESEEDTPKRAESGLQGWIDCYEKSALKAHLFCGGVNDSREINGNPKLQEAFELGKNV